MFSKSRKKILGSFLGILILALSFTAGNCPEDPEPPVVANLEDGNYLIGSASYGPRGAKASKLQPLVLDGTRDELTSVLIYLNTGKFSIATYKDNEVTNNTGGTKASTETIKAGDDSNLSVDFYDSKTGNDSIEISTAGFYQVFYDQGVSKIVTLPIKYFQIIGDATGGGWDDAANQIFTTKSGASRDSVVMEVSNVTMRGGSFKFRWNGMWDLFENPGGTGVMKKDTTRLGIVGGIEWKYYTNVGGSLTSLTYGNGPDGSSNYGNMSWDAADKGTWKFKVVYKGSTTSNYGLSIASTKTADAPAYEPPSKFAIVGDATPGGWPADGDTDPTEQTFTYKKEGTIHTWELASITLTEENTFKIRANDGYDVQVHATAWTGAASYDKAGDSDKFDADGENFAVKIGEGGSYKIVLTYDESNDAGTITFTKLLAPAG